MSKFTAIKFPETGQVIFKAYSKELELEGITHRKFISYRKKLPVEIIIIKRNNCFIKLDFIIGEENCSVEYPLTFEKSGNEINLKDRLQKLLSKNNGSFYEIKISNIKNETSLKINEIIPEVSMLKNICRAVYQSLEKIEKEIDEKVVSMIMKTMNKNKNFNLSKTFKIDEPNLARFISSRENMNLKKSRIPFYSGNGIDREKISTFGKYHFIPLKPVVYNENYYKKLNGFIKNNTGKIIFLGINNIHHFKFLESLEKYKNVYSFIDFFFYAANSFTLNNESTSRSKVAFGYYWIEGNNENFRHLKESSDLDLFKIEHSFSPPLFLHAGSFAKESLKINWNKKREIKINEDNLFFRVCEDHGFSYIFKE